MAVSITSLLLIGAVFHVLYIFSIFDIYFKSPLVHGMTPHHVETSPPADRLVLFVADGLRADKLFQLYSDPEQPSKLITKAPFIRSLIQNNATWGISHTRVPTESRPGHVAIIAGFYEDVSAVTTGWTMNPVNFDSVFNQSRKTYSWGSPDILPMFQHGASDPSRVETFAYGAHEEDFSKDGTILDTWVFEHVRDFFQNASVDPTGSLYESLHSPKTIFFLHLLGLDITGHSYKPYSDEYAANIVHVDNGIKETVQIIEDFYGHDGRTAYVFTADHGMGNRGAHGDGHPDNTRTPLVVWGAGVCLPNKTHPTGHDEISASWTDLTKLQRNDVRQADIAPLMAALVGIPFPVNSVGEVPLVYLQGEEFKAKVAEVNAKEIMEQVLVMHDQKEKTELFFKPFAPLTNSSSRLSRIHELIVSGDYPEAERLSYEVITLSLDALRYFQTYDWLFLRSIVSAGYLGWIAFCGGVLIERFVIRVIEDGERENEKEITLTKKDVEATKKDGFLIDFFAISTFGVLVAMINIQSMPLIYYAYAVPPVFFWRTFLKSRAVFTACLRQAGPSSFFIFVALLVALEILVSSYFYREVLFGCGILLAIWGVSKQVGWTGAGLAITSIATSAFCLLDVEKSDQPWLVLLGGIIIDISGLMILLKKKTWLIEQEPSLRGNSTTHSQPTVRESSAELASIGRIISFQLVLISASVIVVWKASIAAELLTLICWIIVGLSLVIPAIHAVVYPPSYYLQRLTVIFLAFAPPFILLSVSYEALFYFFFSANAVFWMLTEKAHHDNKTSAKQTSQSLDLNRTLHWSDLRTSLIFMYFINIGFFGTGNVASLSSFELSSVYRFVTVFSPFAMGAVLLLKILIPFVIISSVFVVLTRALGVPALSLLLLVVSITDVQTLNFFFLVRDVGSWLEIGTSISHFVIGSLFLVFVIALGGLGGWFVGKVRISERSSDDAKKNE